MSLRCQSLRSRGATLSAILTGLSRQVSHRVLSFEPALSVREAEDKEFFPQRLAAASRLQSLRPHAYPSAILTALSRQVHRNEPMPDTTPVSSPMGLRTSAHDTATRTSNLDGLKPSSASRQTDAGYNSGFLSGFLSNRPTNPGCWRRDPKRQLDGFKPSRFPSAFKIGAGTVSCSAAAM